MVLALTDERSVMAASAAPLLSMSMAISGLQGCCLAGVCNDSSTVGLWIGSEAEGSLEEVSGAGLVMQSSNLGWSGGLQVLGFEREWRKMEKKGILCSFPFLCSLPEVIGWRLGSRGRLAGCRRSRGRWSDHVAGRG